MKYEIRHLPALTVDRIIEQLEMFAQLRGVLVQSGLREEGTLAGFGLLSLINELREINDRPTVAEESFA